MSMPVEISLKYKLKENNLLGLMVDPFLPVEESTYVWQVCEHGTAKWETMSVSEKNTFFVTCDVIKNTGNKYRCLVLSGKQVKAYSRSLTINPNKFRANRATATPRQQGNERKESISISDTDKMDGATFELFCASLLNKNGFSDVRVTQETGDYGVDILAERDSITYAIQCKCYSSAIGNKAVQEAYSGKSFYNCMVAVVLTNNYFTNAARETAKRNSVVLWDRNDLDGLIRKAGDDFNWRVFAQQERNRKAREEYERQEREREERERQEQARSEWERRQKSSERRQRRINDDEPAPSDFFRGCTTWEQVRVRYRKLMEIYHPDKEAGDERVTKEINAQYLRLKERYNSD